MDLYGPNLATLLSEHNGKFDLQTTLNIGLQILDILKSIHSSGLIYRDVKPENFVIGFKEKERSWIHICDFGLAKFYLVEPNSEEEPAKGVK